MTDFDPLDEMLAPYYKAEDAFKALLEELPAEFSEYPPDGQPWDTRYSFSVIKKSNVRKVHRALYELREYFGLTEE